MTSRSDTPSLLTRFKLYYEGEKLTKKITRR